MGILFKIPVTGSPSYWIATFGGSGSYNVSDAVVASTPDGGVIVSGHFYDETPMTTDVFVTKFSPTGTMVWQRGFGNTGSDDACADVVTDSSGNIYVVGSTSASIETGASMLTAKYSPTGTLLWQRVLGDLGTYARCVAVSSAGDVYVAGSTSTQGAGIDDLLVVKYNASGTLQWQRALGGTQTEIASGIAVDTNNDVYVVGYVNSLGQTMGNSDMLLVKYDSTGAIIWQKAFGAAAGDESALDVTTDSSNNVYVSGYTASQGTGFEELLVLKLNSSGVVQWQKALGGPFTSDEGRQISVDASGNVYVAGVFSDLTMRGAEIAKFNSLGAPVWFRSLTLTTPDDTVVSGFTLDTSGSMVMSGIVFTGIAYEAFVTKLPADGSLTGVHGAWTYQSVTTTETTTTCVLNATTLTPTNTTLVDAAGTLTSYTTSLTPTFTSVA